MIRLTLHVVCLFLAKQVSSFSPINWLHPSSTTSRREGSSDENHHHDDVDWKPSRSNCRVFLSGEATPSENRKGDARPSEESITSNGLHAPPVELVIADSESFLNMVGSFLVESFWLSSGHHQLGDSVEISNEARMSLVIEQCADLQEKYGERLGKRLAKACVVGALDEESKELIGAAALKETLLINNDLLDSEKAEVIAKTAVASLGPKQRRQYKEAPVSVIATELLSPDTKAVCVLSNLAVSQKARRRGIGTVLCEEIEALASDWGYDEVHLLVESENFAARQLYEEKLGYKQLCTYEVAPALRVDVNTGSFREIQADTIVLVKKM